MSQEVCCVEVRAGKKKLKDKYRIRTFDDFETSIGDVIVNTLESVRFLADHQTDSNISRQNIPPYGKRPNRRRRGICLSTAQALRPVKCWKSSVRLLCNVIWPLWWATPSAFVWLGIRDEFQNLGTAWIPSDAAPSLGLLCAQGGHQRQLNVCSKAGICDTSFWSKGAMAPPWLP